MASGQRMCNNCGKGTAPHHYIKTDHYDIWNYIGCSVCGAPYNPIGNRTIRKPKPRYVYDEMEAKRIASLKQPKKVDNEVEEVLRRLNGR